MFHEYSTAVRREADSTRAEKSAGFVAETLLFLLAALSPCRAQVICSGDTPPERTVITAAGTSSICGGACRARRFEPLQGATMVICAQQPIPPDYILESVTTSPACECLGERDNAYVIRLDVTKAGRPVGVDDSAQPNAPSKASLPTPGAEQERFQIGD